MNEQNRAKAAQEQGETVWVRTEGGSLLEMSVPLSEPIADRLAAGQISRVNADGTPWEAVEDLPAAPAPAVPDATGEPADATTEATEEPAADAGVDHTGDPDAEHQAFLARQAQVDELPPGDVDPGEAPAGNASTEDWRAYAVTQGMARIEADSLTRDQLRDRYTT